MRLDRLITLYLVWPLLKLRRRLPISVLRSPPAARRLPILMYHSISNDPEEGVHPYYRTCTSPKRFAEHMQFLADNGYCGVSLTEGLKWLNGEGEGSKGPKDQGPKDQGPGTKDQGPGTKDQGPGTKDQGPGTKDQGPPTHRRTVQLVALTFDDGFRDFYTEAWPVLQRHGFSATVFLPTAFIADPQPVRSSKFEVGSSKFGAPEPNSSGTDLRTPISDDQRTDAPMHRRTDAPMHRRTDAPTSDLRPPTSGHQPTDAPTHRCTDAPSISAPSPLVPWSLGPLVHDASLGPLVLSPPLVGRRSFKGRECLTWPEVRELHYAGIEFGSHTVNHRKLVDLPWSEIESEISNSKSEIEQHLPTQVTTFAYPYAFPHAGKRFTARLRELFHQTGYKSCATTEVGRARPGDEALRLPRLPANSCDDALLLKAKLEGSYDWLAAPQVLTKRLKASFPRNGAKRRAECGSAAASLASDV